MDGGICELTKDDAEPIITAIQRQLKLDLLVNIVLVMVVADLRELV